MYQEYWGAQVATYWLFQLHSTICWEFPSLQHCTVTLNVKFTKTSSCSLSTSSTCLLRSQTYTYIYRTYTVQVHEMFVPLICTSCICSAGVGRTGTFITLDAMMERLKERDDLNIFEFVTEMRTRRTKMIQTPVSKLHPVKPGHWCKIKFTAVFVLKPIRENDIHL